VLARAGYVIVAWSEM